MRTGTVVSLGASAVLGLGALVVARLWLPQPSHAPQAKTTPEVAAGTVPVVVASAAIPYGAKLDASRLTVVRLPSNAVPQGAFATTAQILSQQGGAPVALTQIAAHEPLLPSKLSGPGARPIISAGITEGMRAYTIGITDIAGVGGHVLPGDRVDVIVSRDIPTLTIKGKDGTEADCNGCKRIRADVVLQNIKVLGMDLNADPTTTLAVVAHTATLEVSVQDAQKLAVATQAGSMSLALRRLGQADMTPTRTVEITDLQANGPRAPGGLGDRPRLIAVSRRHGAPAFPGQMVIHTRSVIVVHGDAATSVEVPAERYGAGA